MFLLSLCATGRQPPLEALDNWASASEEGEQCSSYGTGESESDEVLGKDVNNGGAQWTESVEDMRKTIVALNETQPAILDKLVALEKLVSFVQEDTTWVRGDVRVVHEVVEKLADYVSKLSDTVAMVDGVPERTSPRAGVCVGLLAR